MPQEGVAKVPKVLPKATKTFGLTLRRSTKERKLSSKGAQVPKLVEVKIEEPEDEKQPACTRKNKRRGQPRKREGDLARRAAKDRLLAQTSTDEQPSPSAEELPLADERACQEASGNLKFLHYRHQPVSQRVRSVCRVCMYSGCRLCM